MMIAALLDQAARSAECRVHGPAGMPSIPPGFRLPADLAQFYGLCGGVDLYPERDYGISLVPPGELRESNVVILGEQFPDDLSASWFTVGRTLDGEYVSIDLSEARNGRCYDSFHDIHGVAGSSAVVALTFSELFDRLVTAEGGYWYWLRDDFVSLGDAYDEAE